MHTVPYPEVHHTTADAPDGPVPAPDVVSEVGWTWEPEPDAFLEQVEEGSHGPLVALTDGAVSLDGTDGSEIWSYRCPYDLHFEVWVEGDHVIVSRVPAISTEGPLVDVLALDSGAPEPGLRGLLS